MIAGGTYTLTEDCRQVGNLNTRGSTSDIIIRGNGHTIYLPDNRWFITVHSSSGKLILENVIIDHQGFGDPDLAMIVVNTRAATTEPIEVVTLTDVTLQNHEGFGAIYFVDQGKRAQNTQTMTLTRVKIRNMRNPTILNSDNEEVVVSAFGLYANGVDRDHLTVNIRDSSFINIQSLRFAPLYGRKKAVINVSDTVFSGNEAPANILAREGSAVTIGDGITFSGLCGRGVTVPYLAALPDGDADEEPGIVAADFSARPCPRPKENVEAEPESTPIVLKCPSRPEEQSRFGKIGSGEWRGHFARLGIRAADGSRQTEWARGDAIVSGANVCLWEYECSTDGHWAYGHYHATHGHNYQAPGTRPPAAVNRSSGGAFNLCYSVWSGGCHSAEAWQFGHASGKQIYERWLYGRQLQAAPSGCQVK